MGRPKREQDKDLTKEMIVRAQEWQGFREANKLSQKFLAEIIGVSRRTIQSIEAGQIIPQKATLEKFTKLQEKYEAEGKPSGKGKQKRGTIQTKGEF